VRSTSLLNDVNVLLIRLRLIGDVVFTTPAVRALRRAFPGARLTYVVEPEAAPVLALNPHLTDLVVVSRARGLARVREDLALARRLRRRRFDVAIDFHGGPRAAWLAWASGAPRRIGYRIAGRSWMYTDVVDRPRALRARHSVLNQWDLLAALGDLPRPDPARDAVEMPVDPAAASRLAARLAAAGIGPGHRLIVLHVSAGNPFRRWPAASFASLAATLAAADPCRRIVLTAGPSDRAAAARVAAEARAALGPERASQVPDCGEVDLVELRALVDRAALFIGGDSGPLHVAAASRAPIVGVYGPTLPARSAPWRDPSLPTEAVDAGELPCRPCDQRRCAPGDFRCLTRIPAERVAAAAERVLERSA
jgi:lipopolysaccharide heptosyltransferase II